MNWSLLYKYSKLLAGIFLLFFIYCSGLSFVLLFFLNNMIINAALIGILTYQYCFCSKSYLVKRFLRWCDFTALLSSYEIIEEAKMTKGKKLVCMHPHGVFGIGSISLVNRHEELFKANFYASTILKMTPFSGIFSGWLGIEGISNSNFVKGLKEEKSICFMPGGFEEAALTEKKKNRVFIKEKKGFIKYAIQHGYPIYITYSFGENKIVPVFSGLKGIRNWLARRKIPGTLFLPFFWLDTKFVSVISEELYFGQDDNPSVKKIQEAHDKYVQTLRSLYEKHKDKTPENSELIIH